MRDRAAADLVDDDRAGTGKNKTERTDHFRAELFHATAVLQEGLQIRKLLKCSLGFISPGLVTSDVCARVCRRHTLSSTSSFTSSQTLSAVRVIETLRVLTLTLTFRSNHGSVGSEVFVEPRASKKPEAPEEHHSPGKKTPLAWHVLKRVSHFDSRTRVFIPEG